MLVFALIVMVAVCGKVFANEDVLQNHKNPMDSLNANLRRFSELAASIKSSATSTTGLRPAASTTTATSWLVLQGSTSSTCSSADTMVAQAIGINQCYPINLGGSTGFGKITVNGNTATGTVYSDTDCSTAVPGADPLTIPLNSCTSMDGGYIKVTSSTSFTSAFQKAGVMMSYSDSTADCQGRVGIYAYSYIAFASGSSGCLVGLPGDIGSTSFTFGSNNQVTINTYSINNCQGGSTSSTMGLGAQCVNPYSFDVPTTDAGVSTYGPYISQVAANPQPGNAPTSSPAKAECFAGSESVQLASGVVAPISDIRVGDKVLAYSSAAKTTVFSDVVAVPHATNNIESAFQHIVLESGADIKMTAEHLLPAGACATDLPVVRAADVQVGDCVKTISGESRVMSNSVVTGNGVYTIVTKDADFVVVNGIVASPFAVNHVVANFVYDFHRMVYAFAPKLVAPLTGVMANLAAYFTK